MGGEREETEPWLVRSPLDFEDWYFVIIVLVEKWFLFVSELRKWKFATDATLEKIILATLRKNPLLALTWKSPSDAHGVASLTYST